MSFVFTKGQVSNTITIVIYCWSVARMSRLWDLIGSDTKNWILNHLTIVSWHLTSRPNRGAWYVCNLHIVCVTSSAELCDALHFLIYVYPHKWDKLRYLAAWVKTTLNFSFWKLERAWFIFMVKVIGPILFREVALERQSYWRLVLINLRESKCKILFHMQWMFRVLEQLDKAMFYSFYTLTSQ